MRPRLLLVEDDADLRGMLTELFAAEGYDVRACNDGQAGLHAGLVQRFDVLLVDRGLPAIDGVELIRRLRSHGRTTPALMLTARGSLADRVEGLDAGAEDYLAKPFEIQELLARIRALGRRHVERADVLPLAGARLDVHGRLVIPDDGGPEVELSARECQLLRTLAVRPTQVFTREDLLSRVFDGAENPGLVDTYVHYLRRKLGRRAVTTVRGLGYRLGRR
ncbi:MAG: two-component system response regulator [Pseudonocardiales bacterium]|nr:MAG: two-component system response regulator [Pseudonocardiales bacterium]